MTRRFSIFWLFAFGLVVGALAGAGMALDLDVNLLAVIAIFTVVVAVPMSLLWWRNADEAVREAHKSAWFWGGSFAMLIGLMSTASESWLQKSGLSLDFTAIAGHPVSSFQSGALFITALSITGYLIAWAVWWLRHR